uniref:Uncharacterized protein n=1 Tax=Oryza nivara TaxID=4536 RepID=A0A0E0J774_ORYNI
MARPKCSRCLVLYEHGRLVILSVVNLLATAASPDLLGWWTWRLIYSWRPSRTATVTTMPPLCLHT